MHSSQFEEQNADFPGKLGDFPALCDSVTPLRRPFRGGFLSVIRRFPLGGGKSAKEWRHKGKVFPSFQADLIGIFRQVSQRGFMIEPIHCLVQMPLLLFSLCKAPTFRLWWDKSLFPSAEGWVEFCNTRHPNFSLKLSPLWFEDFGNPSASSLSLIGRDLALLLCRGTFWG